MGKRKRVLRWAGLLVALAVAGLAGVRWLAPPAPGATWDNFQRIEIGMSRSEVDRLLGEPGWSFGENHSHWISEAGFIQVNFDGEDRATEKSWAPGKETFFDRLRRWLGL